MKLRILLIGLLAGVIFLGIKFIQPGVENRESLIRIKEEPQMRVEFYKIKEAKKGEYLGYAEIAGGKLYVDVKDKKLEEILRSPYKTIKGEKRGTMIIDKAVTLQPGTISHLKAIAVECWQFGYIGEIVKGNGK